MIGWRYDHLIRRCQALSLCHGRRQNDAKCGEVPAIRPRAERALVDASGKLKKWTRVADQLVSGNVVKQKVHAKAEVDVGA